MSPMPVQSYQLMLADPWTLEDFTDITQLVRGWSGTVRGRQHELQLFQPGQVPIDLNNRGGWFNTWNTDGPFYNLLTPGDASAETVDGTVNTAPNGGNWASGTLTNCTIQTGRPPVVIDGPLVWVLTATSTSASVVLPHNLYAVTAGNLYSIMCSFLANTTGRAVVLGVEWYTSGGSLISTSSATSVTDNTSTWTKASLLGVTAPPTAAFAALTISLATTASTEAHYFSRAALFNYSAQIVNTAWGPGQRGLVPGRPIKATATWQSVDYPVFSMYVSNWTPAYKQVASDITVNCTDDLGMLALADLDSGAYAAQVLADGANNFWRLGDALEALSAADSGPANSALLAVNISFGQTSPILTDDTTVALFQTSSGTSSSRRARSQSQGWLYGAAGQGPNGGGSLEFVFMIPKGTTTDQQLFYSTNGSGISFNPTTNKIQITCNGGGSGATNFFITDTIIANAAWHHLVVSCTRTTGGDIIVYLDGVYIGEVGATGSDSSCLFDSASPFWFGALNTGGLGFAGQMGDIAVYTGLYLNTPQVQNHYALYSAGFAVQYSGDRIAAMLDVLGWPASLRSIATGVQMVQAGTSSLTQTAGLSYLQSVEQSEMGALFVDQSGVLTFYDRHYVLTAPAATVSNGLFSSDGADSGAFRYESTPNVVPAMDDLDYWNDISTQRIGGVRQRVTSPLSIKQGRQRTLVGFTGELQTEDVDVLAQAQWLLTHYETPMTRVRQITLSSVADSGANLPQMLGRSIFDLVTVKWKPQDGTTVYFEQPSLIESISHKVTQDTWVTTWMLSPSETQPYMVLNDPVKGRLSTDNRLAY